MNKVFKLLPGICCTVLPFLLHSSALADSYDALCSGVECRIVLDGKGFTGPAGFIPAHRVAQWTMGGGEEMNGTASAAAGMDVAGVDDEAKFWDDVSGEELKPDLVKEAF